MRLSKGGTIVSSVAILSLTVTGLAFAGLIESEPFEPSGPIAAALDRGFDAARTGPLGSPGISVAIVRDGKIAYTYAGGYADVRLKIPVTTGTRFRAASISKMFTAVAIMQLVEAGRLQLDDPVAKTDADAPHASDITVRQLLSHTSGLSNMTDRAFADGEVAKATTPTAMLAPLMSKSLDFKPGSKYDYSNSNYIVLGQIVEKLTGRSLAAVERERILEPAGMSDSTFESSTGDTNMAVGYLDDAGTERAAPYDASWLYGAGDLVTSASDLAKFDVALMDGKLISANSLSLMQQNAKGTGEGRTTYGLGIMSTPFGTRTLIGHHGGLPGFASENEIDVKSRFAIVVLGNHSRFVTAGVNRVALATLFPTDFALATADAIRTAATEDADLDPTIEPKLRAFLNGVSKQTLDRSTLSPAMATALTQQSLERLSQKLPPYEASVKLEPMRHAKHDGYTIYEFAATYPGATISYKFVLDENGKIAGFFLS